MQFDAQASGEGTFLVLDQRSNLAAPATPTQARWSLKGQSPAIYYFVISGEVAFPTSDGRMKTGRLELSASSDLILPVTSLRGWGIFYSSTADDALGLQDPQFTFVGARVNILTVRVLLPSAGQRLRRGKEAAIEWEVQTASPLVSQRLLISLDGGESFAVLAASLPGDTRNFVWTVRGDLEKTKRALIQVVVTDANGASVEAVSEQMFRIK